jgi:multidrug efflux pump subunit AcrA (membrane-fusion protein)
MTDEPSSGEVQRESRRRRRRLLLILLVALTAITWIFPAASVGLSDFSPKASPTATVAASPIAIRPRASCERQPHCGNLGQR